MLEALFELLRLRAQTLVIERLHALFERVDLFYSLLDSAQHSVVARAEYHLQRISHGVSK